MLKINTYPKNKKHVIKLLEFYKELETYFKILNIKPVVWGSLIYFAYTQDKNYEIHDIDLLLPLNRIYDTRKQLEKSGKYTIKFIEDWNILQIFKNDLLIEVDPLEKYIESDEEFEIINYGDIKLIGVSKKTLKQLYYNAFQISNDKPQEHKRKYENLN